MLAVGLAGGLTGELKRGLAGGLGEKMFSLPGWNRLLSNDIRGLTDNGVSGGDASVESSTALGRPKSGRSPRCCRVERRREDERLGIVANGLCGWTGVGNEGISLRVGEPSGVVFPTSLSKMLNSAEQLGVCTLRRFAEGLPRDAWSKFIIPSLRFKGLPVAKLPKVPLRRFSMRDNVGRGAKVDSPKGAEGVLIKQGLSGVVLCFGATRSSRVKSFSSPEGKEAGWVGVALPPSVETLKARLAGLRGDVRRRIAGLLIFALGG